MKIEFNDSHIKVGRIIVHYKRLIFIPIVCVIVLYAIFLHWLIGATGILNVKFKELDTIIVKENVDDGKVSNAKHALIPKTENKGKGSIDINHSTAEELEKLPGIGEKKANAIVKQRIKMRGFSTLRDIVCTEGVGAETFEKIEPYIKISEYSGNEK